MGHVGHAGRVLGSQNRAAGRVVGVLQRDHPSRRVVHVVGPDGLLHGGGVDHPTVVVGQRVQRDATQDRRAAALGVEDVRLVAEDDLVAPLTLRQDREQVALGAAADEHCGLFAQHLGRHGLQAVDGGVLARDVVA